MLLSLSRKVTIDDLKACFIKDRNCFSPRIVQMDRFEIRVRVSERASEEGVNE